MLNIMYEVPKDKNIGSVTITGDYIKGHGAPIIRLRGQDSLPEAEAVALPEANVAAE